MHFKYWTVLRSEYSDFLPESPGDQSSYYLQLKRFVQDSEYTFATKALVRMLGANIKEDAIIVSDRMYARLVAEGLLLSAYSLILSMSSVFTRTDKRNTSDIKYLVTELLGIPDNLLTVYSGKFEDLDIAVDVHESTIYISDDSQRHPAKIIMLTLFYRFKEKTWNQVLKARFPELMASNIKV